MDVTQHTRTRLVLGGLIDRERLIHSLKTAIACTLGYTLTQLVGFTADQWIVISIIVVMCAQIYVGSVMQKAWLRFLGTLAGCLFAMLAIAFFNNTGLTIMITLGLSTFFFSYLATGQENMSYAGTLGAVTTAIIMLGQKPTILFATERFLEISVGIMIATLISQFVLPIHARTHLRRAQASTLGQLRDYYIQSMTAPHGMEMSVDDHDLDENIVKSLLKQRQLAKESKKEPLGASFDTNHFMQSLYCERDILRAMTFMHNALSQIRNTQPQLIQSAALRHYHESIVQTIDTIIKAISTNHAAQEHIHIPELALLTEEFHNSPITSTQDQLIYLDGFLFSANILANSLCALAMLYQIPVFKGTAKNA